MCRHRHFTDENMKLKNQTDMMDDAGEMCMKTLHFYSVPVSLFNLFLLSSSSLRPCRSDHLSAAAEGRHGAGPQGEPAHIQQRSGDDS